MPSGSPATADGERMPARATGQPWSARPGWALHEAWNRMAAGIAGVATVTARRLRGGEGVATRGRVLLALDPGSLAHLARGRRVALVTGTNGKTTTAHLLAAALRTQGPVAHNHSGANMTDGAVAALATQRHASLAVLEVDELHLARVADAVSPAVVVLLNLTRDQLDRGSEVASVATSIREALRRHPGTLVVANRDDPVVVATVDGLPRVTWVAASAGWSGDASICLRCGRRLGTAPGWSCPCGLSQPQADWALHEGEVRGAGTTTPLPLQLPGRFNRGNALAAMAAAHALGVPPGDAAGAMALLQSVAHRYAKVRLGSHELQLLLAKNPAGWAETLPLLEDKRALLCVINAREADGRDTSWLWDVPFEQLPHRPTVVTGDRAADVGLRLSYAGIEHQTVRDPLAGLELLPPGEVAVVANYTAFSDLWRRLAGMAAR
jgi:UDP-N-acetylmuramyl tripeptide synthase